MWKVFRNVAFRGLVIGALLWGGLSCDSGKAAPDTVGVATREAGWYRGDLHMHTEWSDGWDDTATVIRIAEALDGEDMVAAHPEFAGNGLDFIAITDHRTVDVMRDPAWTSEQLVLIGGEEWGSTGHAGALGITAFVDHDPDGDGATLADVIGGAEAAHAQGGVFSINHPFLPGNPFPWDLRIHDGVEVWNSGWALMSPSFSATDLAEWEADHGPASPIFARAVQDQGRGASFQSLTFYEAMLARGVHVAVIGGSDRHVLVLPGFPTTWIRAQERTIAGLIQGIRDRHTFLSRTPVSTQVLLSVETAAGAQYEMGDEIPVPAAGGEVTVTVRVGRGDGGLLRLIAGEAVESDEALAQATLGEVALEEDVVGSDHVATITIAVKPGSWFYPMVLDPLVRPDLTPEEADYVREVAVKAAATGDEDFAGLANLAVDAIDFDVLLDASLCDPAAWQPDMLQCLPEDDLGTGSFYVPDRFDRAFNVVVENGEITDWCMGALGSAVRFVAE